MGAPCGQDWQGLSTSSGIIREVGILDTQIKQRPQICDNLRLSLREAIWPKIFRTKNTLLISENIYSPYLISLRHHLVKLK